MVNRGAAVRYLKGRRRRERRRETSEREEEGEEAKDWWGPLLSSPFIRWIVEFNGLLNASPLITTLSSNTTPTTANTTVRNQTCNQNSGRNGRNLFQQHILTDTETHFSNISNMHTHIISTRSKIEGICLGNMKTERITHVLAASALNRASLERSVFGCLADASRR